MDLDEPGSVSPRVELPARSERIRDRVIVYRVGNKRRGVRKSVRDQVLRRDNGFCVYCQYEADTVDHIVPWAYGGMDTEDNLVACCQICNNILGDKVFDTFTEKREYIRLKYGPWLAKRVKRIRKTLSICADCQEIYEPRVKGASAVLCGTCYRKDRKKPVRRSKAFRNWYGGNR